MVSEEWYRLNEIRFTRRQVSWILSNLYSLREGIYPPNPQETGYIDSPAKVKTRRSRLGGFEKVSEIVGEIDVRIKRTGLDGFLLESYYCWGKTEPELSIIFNLPESTIRRRIYKALSYITGWRRKLYSYQEFCNHKKVVKLDVRH